MRGGGGGERTAAILEKTWRFLSTGPSPSPARHPRPFRSRGDERDLSPANYNPICDYRRAIVPVVAFGASGPQDPDGGLTSGWLVRHN